MRRFVSYTFVSYTIVAGLLAAGVVVALIGFGLPVGARAAVERGVAVQSVDRTHKGNRLRSPAAAEKPQPVQRPSFIMVGCEAVFSPLSASAQANFVSRCVV